MQLSLVDSISNIFLLVILHKTADKFELMNSLLKLPKEEVLRMNNKELVTVVSVAILKFQIQKLIRRFQSNNFLCEDIKVDLDLSTNSI